MATYKEIFGQKINKVSSDPSNPLTGEMWYNSTTGTLRGLAISESWASGNSMLTGRYNLAGSGTQTAGLIAGGTTPGIVTNTEHFDGIGWRNGGALNTGRDSAPMFGLSTAATFVGGYAPSPNGARALVEEYNGTAWSEETDLPTPRYQGASAGTQTDGIVFGGNQGPPGSPETTATTTLEYNGSSWTTGGAMSVNDRYLMGCGGSQAQALRIGGESDSDATEEYNGSSWTTGGNLNTGRYQGAASGTNTAGLVFGGNPNRTNTEGYDGTSWSNKPTLGTGVEDTSGSAQGTNAEAFQAGQSASPTSIVQSWNSSTNIVTAAAWSTGGALNTARNGMGASGTQTAGLAAGGNLGPSKVDNSEEYNGTSWTEGNNLTTARGELAAAGNSPQTASLVFGGTTSSTPDNPGITNASEEYNGTSWTAGNVMNYSSRNLGGLGTQTSAVAAGGLGPPTYLATTGEYDGTNWTAGTSLPAGLQDNQGMTGVSQTVGLLAGGEGPPGAATDATLEYDGTNWTTGGALATALYGNGAAGIQAGALSFGGNSDKTATEGYDGTAWSTRPSLATGRNRVGGLGTNTAALAVGGLTNPGAVQSLTEEFTGETLTANITNFSTS